MSNTSSVISTETPIPSVSTTVPLAGPSAAPHQLECMIQRGLQSYPGLRFARLTVHQCAQGVCLEGLLETNDEGLDLCDLVNQIAGVNAIDHVVHHLAKPN